MSYACVIEYYKSLFSCWIIIDNILSKVMGLTDLIALMHVFIKFLK